MVVGAKVCDLTEDLLRFVCGLYVGILTSPLSVKVINIVIHIFVLGQLIWYVNKGKRMVHYV